MSEHHSAAFPNLQDLLQHVQGTAEECAPEQEPPSEMEGTWDSVVAPEAPLDVTGRGGSLVLGGLLLLGVALVLACAAAPSWVVAAKLKGEAAGWAQRLAFAQSWWVGLGVLALVKLAMGSFQRRRWAVPLVHAGGWLVAISVLMALAVASAGFFFITPASGQFDKAWLLEIGHLLLGLGIWGVVVPLGVIAIYQRRHLSWVCGQADAEERWTDPLPEPLLMLWECVLLVAGLVAGWGFLGKVFPLFGKVLSGTEGLVGIGGTVGACLLAAWLLARRRRSGWWLAGAIFAFLTINTALTLLQVPWSEVCTAMGRPTEPASLPPLEQPTKLPALLVGAAFAPLAMILLMSRGSFPVEEMPEISTPPHA